MSDLILKYGFQTIYSNVKFNDKKALNLVKSNHVINVQEIKSSDGQLNFISGHVIRQTSVTSMPYKVKIEVGTM